VINLLEGDGVRVNGRRVLWAHLDHGDQLQIGKFAIGIRSDPPSEKREAPRAVVAATAAPRPAPPEPARPQPVVPAPASLPVPRAVPVEPGPPVAGKVPVAAAQALEKTAAKHGPLMPLMNHFAALQRQMVDRFQQTIFMMVRLFKKMERHQSELVRQEVARIQQITEELQGLQEKLDQLPAAKDRPPATASPKTSPAFAPAVASSRPEAVGTKRLARGVKEKSTTAAPVQGSNEITADGAPNRSFPPSGRQPAAAETSTAEGAGKAAGAPRPANTGSPPSSAGPKIGDMHTWLY